MVVLEDCIIYIDRESNAAIWEGSRDFGFIQVVLI